MKKEDTYLEIDLLSLLKAMWKSLWLIVAATVLCGAAAFCIARFCITPLYKASVLMYVNNSALSVGSTKVSISSSDLSAAQSLVDTYVVILNTRATLDEVKDKAGVSYTYEELKDMISAAAVNSTEVFEIVVTSPDPKEARDIGNVIAQVLPKRISTVVEGSSARVVDKAVTPAKKASPSITRYTAVGMLLGIIASCGCIAVRTILDDRIHDEDCLLQMYENIPVLTVVPELTASESDGYGYGYYQAPSGKRKGASA